ncbi:MAG: 4-amino-4-deoxy-L-arabinose transferase [Flavobacteriaceae bacterium]|nr:MAG: 4-amino-4-deoxy-L-arabinose transferase [Flavobacteriaceae bacterium]
MIKKLPKIFLLFLGAIFLLNLLQGHLTELIFDEAYYWHYAQKMAWGYFDHPPMVAVLVKISSFFFNGELGVRFMGCVMSTGIYIILWHLIDNPKKKEYITHFFVLVFSMTLVHAYGFLTLPDTPLLFFTALFLWVYKKFLSNPSISLSISLGVVMAALMYSKYHAVLVILFVLLSNYRLVLNKYAWLAVLVALLCYTPHFIWLFENDFVSIKYHLFERPNRAYEFEDFTLGYFINLIAILGLTFPWIYWALFKTKASDKFIKSLLFLTYGVLIFFFISSFNRRVQTQWIIVISIPLAVLTFNFLLQNQTVKKWIFRMGIANIIVLLFLRIGLVHEPMFPVTYETHGNKKWVSSLYSQVGNTPVVFENSYRLTPMYNFYSGNTSYSLNNLHYRKNQYSIDSTEFKVQHKKVVYISKYMEKGVISFLNNKGTQYNGKYIDNFESYRKLKSYIGNGERIDLTEKGELTLKIYNPYNEDIAIEKLIYEGVFLNKYKQIKEAIPITVNPLNKETKVLRAKDTTYFMFKLPTPKTKNPGYFKVSIAKNGLLTGLNGENVKLK